jgi:hypothetical protein
MERVASDKVADNRGYGFYQNRIEKFVSEREKYLNYGADYVEKQ